MTTIKTHIFTYKQLGLYMYENICNKDYDVYSDYVDQLEKDIHYFSATDLAIGYSASQLYKDSLKFIVCIENDINIVGVAKIAVYENDKDAYSLSYLSVHKDKIGCYYSQFLTKKMFEYVNGIFKNPKHKFTFKNFSTSQYTPKGWKYLRPQLIKYCNKYNIPFLDNVVSYPDYDFKINKVVHTEEFYELVDVSREDLKSLKHLCY
jgi:hypothetical protein